MKKGLILTVGAFLLLTGCDSSKTEVQSMDYYKAHLDEAKAVKESCDTKIKDGEIKIDYSNLSDEAKNCMNATGAVIRSGGSKPIKGNEPVRKTW